MRLIIENHNLPTLIRNSSTSLPAHISTRLFINHLPRHLQQQNRNKSTSSRMSIEKAKESFFNVDQFAVVGASVDRQKYGNKVLRWYKDHGLDVVPVHPKEESIEELKTIQDVKQIQNPTKISLSVITPPKITLPIIQNALLDLKVNAVWLQPGAEDATVKEWIESNDQSIKEKVIYGGPCILVQGEGLARAKGKL